MRYLAIAAGFAIAISAMFALVPAAKAKDMVMSDGKCWMNDKDTHFRWGGCPGGKHGHHKH